MAKLIRLEIEIVDMMISLERQGLTEAVRGEIEALLLSGDLKMGDRINEVDLAGRFGVSRGPIREACRGLAERGVLTIVPYRGAYVREISLAQAQQLYELRAGLFGYAGFVAAQHPNPALVDELRELHAAMRDEVESDRMQAYYSLNLRFHSAILEHTGNKELIMNYENLVAKLHLFRASGLVQPGNLRQSNQEHSDIIDAMVIGQPLQAFSALHQHVQAGMRRMLFAQPIDEEKQEQPRKREA